MNPNPPSDLEARLARVPRRRLPDDLRQACLDLARTPQANPNPPTPQHRAVPFWHRWLWPHPAAWATLAAVWCLILALHTAAPVPINVFAATGPSIPLLPDADSNRQLVLQREARQELLRLSPPPPLPRFDLDRPRNSQPLFTNRIA